MTQHSGGSKNSNEDSNGNRTPDPDANEKSDGNDISVDNIKEEKSGNGNPANPGQVHPHGSPLMDQMNKSREIDGKELLSYPFQILN